MKLQKENKEQTYVGVLESIRTEFFILIVLAILATIHTLWPGGESALKLRMIM